jgi:protein-disulfide isomerase
MRYSLCLTGVLVISVLTASCSKKEEALERIDGFYVGQHADESKRPDAYVLFDPQCGYCAAQWRNFEPLYSQVVVKWIPVAVLNERSEAQAAMLLQSEDPAELMAEHQAAFASTGSAPADVPEVSEEARAAVRRNSTVLDNLGTKSVPTIVYRDSATDELVVTGGVLTTRELGRALAVGVMPTDSD